MENIPPSGLSSLSAMTVGNQNNSLPTLDQLISRSKQARKSTRTVRILSPRPNEHTESTSSADFDSGLPSPPESQNALEIDDSLASISPPPGSLVSVHTGSSLSASKRKRQANSPPTSTSSSTSAGMGTSVDESRPVDPAPVTPNPKPRKQSRRTTPSHHSLSPTKNWPASYSHISLPKTSTSRQSTSPSKRPSPLSPHAANPNADFIPPLPFNSRHLLSARNRRSVTPYEPPRDTFTPPREVLGTPIAKTSKRKQPPKRSGKQLKFVIKDEPPDLELNLPLPPASPTEDPLLLADEPPRDRSDSKRTFTLPQVKTSPDVSTLSQWDESPISTATSFIPATIRESSTSSDILPRANDIVFPPGEWSDSDDDDDEFDQSGEFTGRFTTILVPTKEDPPTSATKDRQEAWGRPVSPYPYPNHRKSRWSSPFETGSPSLGEAVEPEPPGSDGDQDDDQDAISLDDSNSSPFQGDSAAPGGLTRREPPSTFDAEHLSYSEVVSTENDSLAGGTWQAKPQSGFVSSTTPSVLDLTQSHSERQENHFPHTAKADTDMRSQRDSPIANAKHLARVDDEAVREKDSMLKEDQHSVDHELSRDENPESYHEDDTSFSHFGLDLSSGSTAVAEKLDSSAVHDESDEDEDLDLGVIKISSGDPMAAARAAAILKMHNYDCLPEIHMRKRRSQSSIIRDARRRGASASGVSKGTPPRRSSAARDNFSSLGSPVMTLPELLQEAEQDLEKSVSVAGSTGFRTPIKSRPLSSASYFASEASPDIKSLVIKPREWNKNDWKLLDACFTDERLDVGERLGFGENTLADVHHVKIDDITNRFIRMVGGDPALEILGLSWSRENILRRTRALEKKQRAGKGAPGTPTREHTPTSDTSVSIEVPDFTPLGRRRHSAIYHDDGPILPPSLLAPRYSHLMNEAVSISKGQGTEELEQRSPSPGLFRRLTSPLFSYLPNLVQPPREQRKTTDQHGLPLPPPEVFEKERHPIVTPVPKPAPRHTHPKDLVHLQPAPQGKPSLIPRGKTKPRRLVDLRHLPLPPAPVVKAVPSDRRSSGGSVKDLVKSFEKLDESTESTAISRSTKSIREWRAEAPGVKNSKPKWKP